MSKNRLVSLDIARGLAIILVIALHGVVSIDGRLNNVSPYFMNFFDSISSVRMPMLMFMSGLFVSHSIKKDAKEYVKGKFFNLVYPYILWSFFMYAIAELRGLVKGGGHISFFNTIFFSPIEHLWFLHSLIIFFIIFLICFIPYGKSFVAMLSVFFIFIPVEYIPFRKDLYFLFCMGAATGVFLKRLSKITLFSAESAIGLLGVVFAIFLRDKSFYVANIILTLSMIPMFFAFGNIEYVVRNTKLIRWIGVNSIVFYLSHLPIQMILVQFIKLAPLEDNTKVIINMLVGFLITWFFAKLCIKYSFWKKILFSPRFN